MSLRTRLFLSLLLLALIPTTILTLFTWNQLNRAIDRWHRPGVTRALEAGLEVGRTSVARIEAALRASAERWAATWPEAPWSERERRELATRLTGTGVDVVQVYRRTANGEWMRIDEVTPTNVLIAAPVDVGSDLAQALGEDQTIRSRLLGAVDTTASGAALVAAIQISPGFFDQLDSLGQGALYYRQLGLTVELQRRWYGLLVVVVVLGVALVALALSRSLARGTAQPILELSSAFDRVARGDLETRVQPSGAEELAHLGSAFNVMTGRLQAARASLQQAEREAAWRDVARMLAHEFNNMITPMRLHLQLIEHRIENLPVPEGTALRRQLAHVAAEVDHLARLARQFAQYARLPEPRLEPVDPGLIAERVAGSDAALETRLLVMRSASAEVQGDPLLLERALHNLVLNAAEADAGGGPIEIEIQTEGQRVIIEVRDRGPGIPPELRDRLFEPYVSTKRRGSGLGLSLVRDIARQHGGEVELRDREGGGTCARLVLPRRVDADSHPAARA